MKRDYITLLNHPVINKMKLIHSLKNMVLPVSGLRSLALAGLLLGTSASLLADSGRGRHAQMYIVPTPHSMGSGAAVTIDGHLDDWDLSGQIESFVIEATRSTMSAKIAAMYDADALYISGEVRDPTPMMNRHDPKVNPNRAWDADSFQFRLVTNPEAEYPVPESSFKYRVANPPEGTRDDIVHMLMWYYTDEGTANLQMQYGMTYRTPREHWQPDGLVPADKFEAVFREWEDGTGYTFEYRIPWSTMGVEHPPQGGDKTAGTYNVLWSRPDGLATGGGAAWAYDVMGQPGFAFQSANTWGRLIFAEEGNVPEELVRAGLPPERTLPLEFSYDLPEDTHTTIQLFNEENQAVRILVPQQERPGGRNTERWDGLDDRGRILPAGTYQWRGIYHSDPIEAKYRFSVHNSGNPPHPTDDNKGGWGGDHGLPRDVVAFEDGLILAWDAAEYGWGMVRTDLKGQRQWGTKHGATYLATDGKRFFVAGDHGFYGGLDVKVFDLKDARPLAFSGGVSSLEAPAGGDDRTNVVTGLAYGNGKLYVSYRGRDLIGVFDGSDGSLVTTWEVPSPGHASIRPDGSLAVISKEQVLSVRDGQVEPWLSEGLTRPSGLVVAADGTAYVTDRGDAQAVLVFDPAGRYLRHVGKEGGRPAKGAYDPSGMFQPGGITLDRQNRLWVTEMADFPKRISVWDAKSGENLKEFFGGSEYFAYGYIDPAQTGEIYAHNVLWDIDWEAYTTQPRTTIWRKTEPDMAPPPNVDAHTSGGGFRMFTDAQGRQFGWGGASGSRGMILYIRDGDLFRPFAGVINPRRDSYPGLDEATRKLDQNHFWYDVNGNGKVDADEITPFSGMGHNPHILWIDEDLTMRFTSGHVLRPSGESDRGHPVFDFAELEASPLQGKLNNAYLIADAEGAAYSLQHREGPSLIKWSPEGEMLWNYPDMISWRDAMSMPIVKPGRLWATTRPMGIAGDFLAYQNYMGINHIFRLDGQYVGAILQDGRLGGAEAYEGQPEGQGGAFIQLNLEGKDRIFAIHGGQDVRVWEVLGLDTIRDLPGGEYVHTEAKVAEARRALEAYEAALAGARELRILPGGREALEDAELATRELEGDRGLAAAMAYDAENLYIRYEIQSPHGLVNGQSEPHIIFRGGNLLDLQIATNPQADPERETPAPGDLRLLVTRQGGESVAMLYRPKVAGFTGTPTVLTSPTGTESFDSIEKLDVVELDYQPSNGGFTATVTVPLDALGLELRPGREVRLDLGYVFGNAAGTRTAMRAYLYNDSFTSNITDDIPHESRLEPAEWGTATVNDE